MHLCEGRLIFVLLVRVNLGFRVAPMSDGGSSFIPDITLDSEMGNSDNFELSKVSISADMGLEFREAP